MRLWRHLQTQRCTQRRKSGKQNFCSQLVSIIPFSSHLLAREMCFLSPNHSAAKGKSVSQTHREFNKPRPVERFFMALFRRLCNFLSRFSFLLIQIVFSRFFARDFFQRECRPLPSVYYCVPKFCSYKQNIMRRVSVVTDNKHQQISIGIIICIITAR